MQQIADAMVRVTSVVEPNPQAADLYDGAYEKFRRVYPALRTLEG